MVVLICGSRSWEDTHLVHKELARLSQVELVLEGGAGGADRIGRLSANILGIPVKTYPADWHQYGRAAGPIRNRQMLNEGKPDLVLAFWDGKSRGTKDMISIARKAGVEVRIITV